MNEISLQKIQNKVNRITPLFNKIKTPIIITTISKPIRVLYVNPIWISQHPLKHTLTIKKLRGAPASRPLGKNQLASKLSGGVIQSYSQRMISSTTTEEMINLYNLSSYGVISKDFSFNNGSYTLNINHLIKCDKDFMISVCNFTKNIVSKPITLHKPIIKHYQLDDNTIPKIIDIPINQNVYVTPTPAPAKSKIYTTLYCLVFINATFIVLLVSFIVFRFVTVTAQPKAGGLLSVNFSVFNKK